MPVKPEYKVTLLGAGGVGKSALTLRIISGVFTPTYNPTVEDYYRHDTMVDGVGPCVVEILDTAGTEQFASMKQLYMTNCRAFALVYSVDDKASFDETLDLYQQILSITSNPKEVTVMLIGNKCDLEECTREVEITEGQHAARNIMNNCPFIETSARDGTNVQKFFVSLVALMSGQVKNSASSAVQRRHRASSVSKSLLQRSSLKIGGRRERSHSQPDLSVYSTDSGSYSNYTQIPSELPDGVANLSPGENARKKCSIM